MYTDRISSLANSLVYKLDSNKTALGLKDVFYGDQERIPRTPAVCVEPGTKERELNGAPRRTLVKITIYLIVYHMQLAGTQTIRRADDALADDIEAFIHNDPFLKDEFDQDQVISSLVVRIESGYQQKRNSIFRASILTIEMDVQVQLPTGV